MPQSSLSNIGKAKSKAGEINMKQLYPILAFYGAITFLVSVVIYNLSFIVEAAGFSSSYSGIMLAIFYLALTLPGFFLNQILLKYKAYTLFYCLLISSLGLALIFFFHHIAALYAGCFFSGLGIGVVTPLIYEKTALSTSDNKSVLGMSLVMALNNFVFFLTPFLLALSQIIFDQHNSRFPFLFCAVCMLLLAIYAFARRKVSFLFGYQPITDKVDGGNLQNDPSL